jgi:membrane fusion protein (multidrug efflux system)
MADLAETTYQRDLKQFQARVVSKAQLDTDLGNLKSARAQVDAEQALLDEKIVRAPFTGRLGLRQVDVGQYLNPGTPIVTLQALDPLYADFYVPQQALAQITASQAVSAHVDPYSSQDFSGKITAIDAKVDIGTRNVKVRATLANPDRKLLPGMSAEINVMVGSPQRLLTLPQSAITFNPYGSTVYVVTKDGTKDTAKYVVHSTLVKTGARRGDQVAIMSGIHSGDTVVTAGQIKLRNGTAVVIDNSVQPSASADPRLSMD